ncbi:MAG: 3-dehydroquinate synthase [Acidobacteria bacterium]|nr:3-dehydroquinate synthase [Acidobacteriota bacterium]
MPSFAVTTPANTYTCLVQRGALSRITEFVPAKAGKLFVVTTEDVWDLHATRMLDALGTRECHTILFPGGEPRKRLSEVETMADEMLAHGADRSSLVIAFGGGIVGDLAGFLAAVFMRGIGFIQAPTTLLAQVDAAVGGKTGANLVGGKNLIGAFHQPTAVVIDPEVLGTLPEREYRAGLYEVVKTGVIRSPRLFGRLLAESADVLNLEAEIVEDIIAESVRIKAEVVSADEKESGLRRILNFGHTIGHALEAETEYSLLLHGEAVAFGMRAVTHLARDMEVLGAEDHLRILSCIDAYGPIPPLDGVKASNLMKRLVKDKKTIQGRVHFVLPVRVGETVITSDVDPAKVLRAAETALEELAA